MVNITAQDLLPSATLPGSAVGTCDLPIGVFSGSVAPGGSVNILVAKGQARKLEIFTYLRTASSEACPALTGGFQDLNRDKIVRVGQVASFDVVDDQTDVSVNVTAPQVGESLITQYSLPSSCHGPVQAPSPGSRSAGFGLGHAQLTSPSGYKIDLKATALPGKELTGAGYTIRFDKGTD
jgi:hypothetical protein